MALFSKTLGFIILVTVIFGAGVLVGRLDSPNTGTLRPIFLNPYLIQGDPELLPLPGPGQQPSQQPGGEVPQDCVLLFQDGQLYRMQPGQGGMPGFGDGSPELLPLEPVPNIPGLPIPRPAPNVPKGLES
jgi:hypothetical protein